MKKFLLAALVAISAAWLVYWLLLALRSDEDRIRALVDGVAEAFNEGSAGGVVEPLAEDFEEKESGLKRREVQLILARFFLQERDSKTREFNYRLEVRPDDVAIELDGGRPDEGKLTVVARLFRTGSAQEAPPAAVVEFAGELKKIDRAWRISRAGHRFIEGRIRF